ncbi:helix-turn-helix domain-containing protein [Sphingobacterium cellulitidis]|uniref:helix-turn-helix domain-containing protein n=1 Tax=Sphingobacterium cellulitidis TaxID=1768011 RepID=UPI00370DD0E4
MKKNVFEIFLTIFCIGLLIQILLMMKRIEFPIPLIFGPLLYLAFLNQMGKTLSFGKDGLHFLPIIIGAICFFLFQSSYHSFYLHFYFITILSSMFIYPSLVIFSKKKDTVFVNERNLILLEILALLGFAIFFFINIIYINHLSNNVSNYHPQLVISSIIVVNIAVLTWFLINNRFSSSHTSEEPQLIPLQQNDTLIPEKEIQLIQESINSLMENEHLYLDAHLTLETLGKLTGFNKCKIEFYINNILNSNFEDWLASFRIKYAISLIHSDSKNFKLEYLSNLCGFDSRTAFNKYFKLYVGESPSNYRSKLIK